MRTNVLFGHPLAVIVLMRNYLYPSLRHTVKVISRLLMDPTTFLAIHPQVQLLGLIWCKIGIFDTFLLLNFLNCLIYDTLDDL